MSVYKFEQIAETFTQEGFVKDVSSKLLSFWNGDLYLKVEWDLFQEQYFVSLYAGNFKSSIRFSHEDSINLDKCYERLKSSVAIQVNRSVNELQELLAKLNDWNYS